MATVHGLRSTFHDWCATRPVQRELAELALAHAVGSEVERAYRRSDLLDQRRELMHRWIVCAWYEGCRRQPSAPEAEGAPMTKKRPALPPSLMKRRRLTKGDVGALSGAPDSPFSRARG